MPIHDWKTIRPGLFHDFHQRWAALMANVLNRKILPNGFSAYVESRWFEREVDIGTFRFDGDRNDVGGTLTAARPKASIQLSRKTDDEWYASRANRVKVLDEDGATVAVIEIVSPGNKSSRVAFADFMKKSVKYLRNRVHLLVIDLLPPSRRDPQGMPAALWNRLDGAPFELPPGKDRSLGSFAALQELQLYVEPIGVGDALPEMPLYIIDDQHVLLPLESTYLECWDDTPEMTKRYFTGKLE